jgi:hypothetical protein
MALVVAARMFTFFFHIANDQRKFPINHMDSLWRTAMATFLGWTLSNCAFYLNENVKPPLIRATRIACFVTNFALVFGLFTSNKECATPDNSSFSISASFANPIRFGMTTFTMGSSITFHNTSLFVRMLGNATRVFSID